MQSSGQTDSGVTARVFGTILTWMQEHKKPVFLIATANKVESLPPELLRKGRFDEIFYIDLPQPKERKEIISIHLNKKNRDPENYNLQALVKATEGYSGAEIQQAIKDAIQQAFYEQVTDVSTNHILAALKSSVPISVTMKEGVEYVRNWAKNRARPASETEQPEEESVKRKVSIKGGK